MFDALFPYSRAVGRKEYALRLIVCAAISAPVLWWRWHVVAAHQASQALVFVGVLIVVLAVIQAQLVGRLRDMGASPFISGLVLVPYVNAALALALLFFPRQAQERGDARSRAASS